MQGSATNKSKPLKKKKGGGGGAALLQSALVH